MKEEFNQYFVQLIIGLQSAAWMALGKVMNPATGKTEINLELAKDSIDALLMLKEKTKGNLTETEKGLLENSMQDLQLNYIEVSKEEGHKETNKKKEESTESKGPEEKSAMKRQELKEKNIEENPTSSEKDA